MSTTKDIVNPNLTELMLNALGNEFFTHKIINNQSLAVCNLCEKDENKKYQYKSSIISFDNMRRHIEVSLQKFFIFLYKYLKKIFFEL